MSKRGDLLLRLAFHFLLWSCAGAPVTTTQDDPYWERVGGDKLGCVSGPTCTSQVQSQNVVSDFAFDGETLWVTTDRLGVLRYDLVAGTWSDSVAGLVAGNKRQLEVTAAGIYLKTDTAAAVVKFDRQGNRLAAWEDPTVDTQFNSPLRLSLAGHPLLAGPLKANGTQIVLVDIDFNTGMTTQRPLPSFRSALENRYSLDEQGRVYYPSTPLAGMGATMTVLDSAGVASTVSWASPPPDAEGNKFPAFIEDLVWGPAPGGGVLGFRQMTTGMMLVRITPDGKTADVVPAPTLSSVTRLRVRDGYVYASGVGLWRTKQKVF